MPGMLFLMPVQSLVQFEAKEENERTNYGGKNCPYVSFHVKDLSENYP